MCLKIDFLHSGFLITKAGYQLKDLHMYIHAQKLLYFQQIKHANNTNFAFPSQLL